MPVTLLKPLTPKNSDSMFRAAQDRGELPLGAVQREQVNSVFDAQGSTDNKKDDASRPTPNVGTQVMLSPLSQLKEMLRQRVADLMSRSEALVQRIALSGPDQIEALSKELKRLGLELKRLISQYKALKGMASIGSFGAESAGSGSIENLGVSGAITGTITGASAPIERTQVESVLKVEGEVEVQLDQTMSTEVSVGIETTELEQELSLSSSDSEANPLESLKPQALELYKELSGQNDERGDRDGDREETGAGEQDNTPAMFIEILKKLKQAKELLELKARLAKDEESLKVLWEVELVQQEIEAELNQISEMDTLAIVSVQQVSFEQLLVEGLSGEQVSEG